MQPTTIKVREHQPTNGGLREIYCLWSKIETHCLITRQVALTGLKEGPNPWHVHENPIQVGDQCDPSGGHYAPEDTQVLTERSGELTERHQALPAAGQVEVTDTVVKLQGANSIQGRSIVIHKVRGRPFAR